VSLQNHNPMIGVIARPLRRGYEDLSRISYTLKV